MITLDGLSIDPVMLASQGNAILGIRGSGKTFTATLLAERIFAAGIPFVAFDPIGVWRYLRVPGAGPGLPVVVAGGEAGDLPLSPANAPEIVRAAMRFGVSLVIDLYSMELSKADWRRIVRESVRVLLYENGAHGLRHVFIEETAEFAPQKVTDGLVYAEVEKLARMGGNARLGYTLINQRAEEVNKAVLELCDNLFLHRQKGRNSLTALAKWLDIANVRLPGEIIDSLPTLPQGECWAWLAGSDQPVRIKVPAKNSFHPDRTAMTGAAPASQAVDAGEFVAMMRTALDRAEEAADQARPTAQALREAEERGYRRGHAEGRSEALTAMSEQGRLFVERMRAVLQDGFNNASSELVGFLALPLPLPDTTRKLVVRHAPPAEPPPAPSARSAASAKQSGSDGLLSVAVRHWPVRLTWGQIAALAGRKPRGGHFNASRKALVDGGLVRDANGTVDVTEEGFARAGGRPDQPADLAAAYLAALPGPANKMLAELLRAPNGSLSIHELAAAIELQPRGGHWNSGIATLERCGIVRKDGARLVLTIKKPEAP